MLDEFQRQKLMYQDEIAYEIARRFGEKFTCLNENGNLALSKVVLAAFRKLSGDSVVWCRSERFWRPRESWDLSGRQQP